MSANFDALLAAINEVGTEADTLAKAIPAAAPAAAAPAAATAGAGGMQTNPEDDVGGDDADDAAIAAAAAANGEKPTFGKSFQFVDDTGAQHEAVDATDMLKALMTRVDTVDEVLAKALTSMAGSLKAQGELIKSLSGQVQSLSGQGRGRKAMLTVVEKPAVGDTMAKSTAAQGITPEQFFAKANAAFDVNKLSGKELNVISVCLRGGHQIDPALIQKVALA